MSPFDPLTNFNDQQTTNATNRKNSGNEKKKKEIRRESSLELWNLAHLMAELWRFIRNKRAEEKNKESEREKREMNVG